MNKPIGVMDSGVGGLTVVKEIIRQMPDEEILYFGDIKRCPYGEKILEEVRKYTIEVADYLVANGVKMVVVACNTATAAALDILEERYDVPVVGVIEPGARSAIQSSTNRKVIVLATRGTVNSGAYKNAIINLNKNFQVESLACPKFVPLVEEMRYKDRVISRIVVHQTLKELYRSEADTVILGCTHYPLLAMEIQDYFGDSKKVIDSGYETARDVSAILTYQKARSESRDDVCHTILVHGDTERFEYILKDWLPFTLYEIKEIEL